MKITLIAAHDSNRLIGSSAGLPWFLPRDQQYFRSYTAGKAMLLGRRTFEEMLGWFTDQRPIVVSRDSNYDPSRAPQNLKIAPSISKAIDFAQEASEPELVVSGGAQIYQQALPVADELLITEVHAIFSGDSFFPEYSQENWQEIFRQRFDADAQNPHALSFVHYQRR